MANIYDLSDTWNDGGTTFNAIKMNVTDTASASASLLMDLQVGGASKFKVDKSGALTTDSGGLGGIKTGIIVDTGDFRVNVNGIYFVKYGNLYLSSNISNGYRQWLFQPGTGFILNSGAYFGWSDQNFNIHSSNYDTTLYRDAAGTLAQRNSTNAQTFNLYNTYTDGSNYERGFMKWNSNVLEIGTEKDGTGTARALEFQTDGTTRLTISSIGAVEITRYLNIKPGPLGQNSGIYFGVVGDTRAQMQATGVGVIGIANYSGNDFDRLQFGGTTSSFPAIKRSTTSLQARLADDTGFTNIQGKLTTETAYTAGAPTATGYIVLYDSTGTAYKVPAEAL